MEPGVAVYIKLPDDSGYKFKYLIMKVIPDGVEDSVKNDKIPDKDTMTIIMNAHLNSYECAAMLNCVKVVYPAMGMPDHVCSDEEKLRIKKLMDTDLSWAYIRPHSVMEIKLISTDSKYTDHAKMMF